MCPDSYCQEEAELIPKCKVPFIVEPYNLPLRVSTHHPGLLFSESVSSHSWFADVCQPQVRCHHAHCDQSGEGSILLDPHQIGNDVKLHDSEHAEALWPLQLSPQETHQVLGYLLSFLWVAENASKNRSVPSSPRRGLQPKNVSPSFPKHRHHFLARSPSLPNQQLPKEWPFSHLENRLPSGEGRGESLDSRKETFLMNCGKNCSFKASWLPGRRCGPLA